MSAAKDKDKPPSFEQAVAELESIIERIEAGELDLDESLSVYEKGMKLVAHCRQTLDQAEKKIAELSVDEKGAVKVKE